MKKSLLFLALLSGMACAEDYVGVELEHQYKNGDGFYVVKGGETCKVEGCSFSDVFVTGRGGVFYVTENSTLELRGYNNFSYNYAWDWLDEGSPAGEGERSDVYLDNGSTLTATATTVNELHVWTASNVRFEIYGGDSVELTDVTIGASSVSGTFTGIDINIIEGEAGGNPAVELSNMVLTESLIFVDDSVTTTASGMELDAESSLTGNVVLNGNNKLALNLINSVDSDSSQLDGATLGADSSLVLTLSSDWLSNDEAFTILLRGLSAEEGAVITSAHEGLAVIGVEQDEEAGGVKVTFKAVPEPTTVTLSLLGVLAFTGRRRRRA